MQFTTAKVGRSVNKVGAIGVDRQDDERPD